jgi:16S rRNA (guanine(1405)-N(7))-methyltransferase
MNEKFIPEKLVQDSVEKIVKRYKISEEQAESFFLEEAFKNKKFIENVMEFYEKKNFRKWKEYRKIMKKTKKIIYYYLRQYKQESPEKVQEKFEELKEKLKKEKKLEKTISLHKELLKMHISSKERVDFYEKFYEKIFAVTGKPESVLDVSCGFNYFSVPLMKLKKVFYIGTEHKKEYVERIHEYFSLIEKYSEIKGKGFLLDLKERDFETRNELMELNKEKEFDLAFLLKLVPVMEREKKDSMENLMDSIPAKWFVLSCSKESMTKKENILFRETSLMNKFIKDNSLYLSAKIEFANEIVFIVKKE